MFFSDVWRLTIPAIPGYAKISSVSWYLVGTVKSWYKELLEEAICSAKKPKFVGPTNPKWGTYSRMPSTGTVSSYLLYTSISCIDHSCNGQVSSEGIHGKLGLWMGVEWVHLWFLWWFVIYIKWVCTQIQWPQRKWLKAIILNEIKTAGERTRQKQFEFPLFILHIQEENQRDC